ncbi:MAG: DMT family transporter [Bacteroidales bacterium]|nr:DMT family transporter [Bacteroidales bacterium]
MKKILTNTYFLAIVACLLWSTAFTGIKLGISFTTPLNFAGTRFILSGFMVLPFCGNISAYFSDIYKNIRYILVVGLFQTFLLYSLFYIGISMTPASLTAIIVGGAPLFVALLAHFTISDDRLNTRKMVSILIGISGIVLIAADKFNVSWEKGKVFYGLIILVLSNIAGSYGNILVSKGKGEINPLVLNSAQQVIGGTGILILSLFLEDRTFGVKPAGYYISLGYLSFLSAAAFSIWFLLLKRPGVKVSELNIWKFLIPVFGAVLSWIVLPDESPALIPVIGMVVISLSLILLNYNNSKARNHPGIFNNEKPRL